MNTRKNTLTVSILTLALLASVAVAAPVEISVSAAGLDFAAKAAGTGYKLTVSGPDGYLAVDTFEDGALPYFDAAGLEDGHYNYELTALLDEPAGTDRGGVTLKTGPLASGSFLVQAGSVADPNLPESFLKDNVIIDDLIVDGSACIGIDCANGESFGFDTLRLKENNLRIKFDDTSASASFPNNDWQLTANDSSNGGANKFAVDDITGGKTPFTIEAGAPNHTLYVASEGRIGIGTSNPVVNAHIIEGNTPTLRLEQDGSSGFTPQTWDLAGNETNFFLRDVTGGSKLPFRVKPGAPDNSIFVAAGGDIGLGTDAPDRDLHVKKSDASSTEVRIENTNTTTQSAGFQLINSARTWNVFSNSSGNLLLSSAPSSGGVGTAMTLDSATGDVTINQLSGGGAESTLCIDNGGKICRCGSC